LKTTALVVTQAETEDPNSAYFKHHHPPPRFSHFLDNKELFTLYFSMFKIVGVFAETSFFSHKFRLRLLQRSIPPSPWAKGLVLPFEGLYFFLTVVISRFLFILV